MRNFKVYIDGQEYEVAVEEIGATTQESTVEVKAAPVKKAVAGGTPVKAPMEGMIKELKVAIPLCSEKNEWALSTIKFLYFKDNSSTISEQTPK